MSLRSMSLLVAMTLWATHARSSAAISVGELDDFSSTLEGWVQPASTPTVGVSRVTTGGPAGAGDAYMQIIADGLGDHGGLVAFNQSSAWTGDYLAAGVTSVSMAVNNLGATDLSLRLVFGTAGSPREGGSWLSSTTPISLPAGSGWTAVEFPIAAADLTLVEGLASPEAVLSGVLTVRLLHAPTPNAHGPFISAHLGVDNILTLGSAPIPGDFDGNQIVDAADLARWKTNFGVNTNADADFDGDSDGQDLLIWQRQLNAAGIATIPEPAALALALCGMAALNRLRRALV